jgi:cell division protease FtsH
VALESDSGQVFLGRDWIRSDATYSNRTGSQIDRQVRDLAVQALDQALAVLRPRRELMDRLVERLIAEETISGESFRESVERWEADNPQMPAIPDRLSSLLTPQSAGEADIEAAKVGV